MTNSFNRRCSGKYIALYNLRDTEYIQINKDENATKHFNKRKIGTGVAIFKHCQKGFVLNIISAYYRDCHQKPCKQYYASSYA